MLVVCVCTLTVSFKPLLIQSFFFAFFQYVCLQQSSRHFGKKKTKKNNRGTNVKWTLLNGIF